MARSKAALRKALEALSDPTRLRIVETIGLDRKTATSLARVLGVEKNRLYYHLRILEQAGVIEVVDSVRNGRLPERRYALTPGQGIYSDELALSGDDAARATLGAAILSAAGVELQAAIRDRSKRNRLTHMSRGLIRTTPAVMEKLTEQVRDLTWEAWAHAGDPEARNYRFTFTAYEPVGDPEEGRS